MVVYGGEGKVYVMVKVGCKVCGKGVFLGERKVLCDDEARVNSAGKGRNMW